MTSSSDPSNRGDVSNATPVLPAYGESLWFLGGGPGMFVPAAAVSTYTSVQSLIGQSNADTLILSSHALRTGATIVNDTLAGAGNMYVLLDNTVASLVNYTRKLVPGESYKLPFGYTGEVRAIWDLAGVGNAMVNEFGAPGLVVQDAVFWVKADVGVDTLVVGLPTYISNWHDQSGYGWDLNDGTSPQWKASEATLNNEPTAIYSTAGLYFLRNLNFNALNAVAAWTVMLVVEATTPGQNQIVFESEQEQFAIQIFGNQIYTYVGSLPYGHCAYAYTDAHVITSKFDGTGIGDAARLELYIDGVLQVLTFDSGHAIPAVTPAGNGIITGVNWAFNPTYFDGYLPEAIVWARLLGATEQANVESYLRTKYGTP